MALATISSLKGHRSSNEPPPLPTIITSTSALFRSSIESAMLCAAASPCTRHGASSTYTGYLRLSILMMSWTAAPVGEVDTPTLLGNLGIGLLRLCSKRPSCSNFFLSCSNARNISPIPSGRMSRTFS